MISEGLRGVVSEVVSGMLVSWCELGELERSIGEDAVSPGCVGVKVLSDEVVDLEEEVSDDCEVV
jgi:hypothetical protein